MKDKKTAEMNAWRGRSVFCFLFCAFGLMAGDVCFDTSNFAGQRSTNRTFVILPLSMTNVPAGRLANYDPISYLTGTNGYVWVSNMVAGVYQVDLLGPPRTTRHTVLIGTNATEWAGSNTVATTQNTTPPGSVAYSTVASDARYATRSGLTTTSNALDQAIRNIEVGGLPYTPQPGDATLTNLQANVTVNDQGAVGAERFTGTGAGFFGKLRPTDNSVILSTAAADFSLLEYSWDLVTPRLVVPSGVDLQISGTLSGAGVDALLAPKLDTNSPVVITNTALASSAAALGGTALAISNAATKASVTAQGVSWQRWSSESNAWHSTVAINPIGTRVRLYRRSSQGPYGVNVDITGDNDSGGGAVRLYDNADNLSVFANGMAGTVFAKGGFIGLNTGTTNAAGKTIPQEIADAVLNAGSVTPEMLNTSSNVVRAAALQFATDSTNGLWKVNVNMAGDGWSAITNEGTRTIELYITNQIVAFNTNTLTLTW